MALAAVPAAGSVPVQPVPLAVETKGSNPLPFFPRMKENAVWAWNASVEKVQTASEALKKLLQKVMAAIRAFFEPKLESAKKTLQEMRDRSTKKSAPVSAPQKQEVVLPHVEVIKAVKEEPKLQAAVPPAEPQFFVPPAVDAHVEAPPRQLEVQMPVAVNILPVFPREEDAGEPAGSAPVVVPPPVATLQPQVEQLGIFTRGWNYFF